jgi:hypothetical protein
LPISHFTETGDDVEEFSKFVGAKFDQINKETVTIKSDMKKMTLTNSTQNKLLQERINAVEKQNTAMKLEMNRVNVEIGSRFRITNNEGLTTLRKTINLSRQFTSRLKP